MSETKKENLYRKLLVAQVQASGEYIAERAEELVDGADLKMSFSIYIDFEQNENPIIRTTQIHAMQNVLDARIEVLNNA